jgi:hypothetical protein
VRFKAVAGSEDRAAGLVWRARDANNYYVVRANALEDNVVLYKTVGGVRSPLDIVGRSGGYGVNVPVPSGQWHALDGPLRMVDRDCHELLYEIPITTRRNVSAEPTVTGTQICPGLLGGMEWNGPAYNPKADTLFVATVDWCGTFNKTESPPKFELHAHYYGGSVTPDPRDQAKGWLYLLMLEPGRCTGGSNGQRHWSPA